jgi:glucose/arabinose dehydrogenase
MELNCSSVVRYALTAGVSRHFVFRSIEMRNVRFFLLVAALCSNLQAAVPSGFTDTLVTAVPGPTAIAFMPDGRILVTSQQGALRVVANGALLPTAALTFNSGTNGNICTNSERGLLGVAVHPEFATNNYIYLYYTHKQNDSCTWSIGSPNAENRVSRFVLPSTNIIDPASETVIVDHIPSVAGNHNGGDLEFGADGLLYITVGDGGCSFNQANCAGLNDNARFLNNLVGKILRVTDNGSIPPANPRVNEAGSQRCGDPAVQPQPVLGSGACVEMFAWGLRNPYRFAFKPGTNTFYINDVGQGTWEEIDVGAINADYGWNVREGHCARGSTTNCGAPPAGMTNPIFDYGHANGCVSITGGAFIPPGTWPTSYDNDYLFADFGCGRIFSLDETGAAPVSSDFATALSSVVALRFGPDGALYYTAYVSGGQLRRISYTGSSNRTPTAGLSASPLT